VHAGDHDVEQLLSLVERAVVEDVELDPGQDPEWRQAGVQLADQLQLGAEPVSGQPPMPDNAPAARKLTAQILTETEMPCWAMFLDSLFPAARATAPVTDITGSGGQCSISTETAIECRS
jgi:hypothetical protein